MRGKREWSLTIEISPISKKEIKQQGPLCKGIKASSSPMEGFLGEEEENEISMRVLFQLWNTSNRLFCFSLYLHLTIS